MKLFHLGKQSFFLLAVRECFINKAVWGNTNVFLFILKLEVILKWSDVQN